MEQKNDFPLRMGFASLASFFLAFFYVSFFFYAVFRCWVLFVGAGIDVKSGGVRHFYAFLALGLLFRTINVVMIAFEPERWSQSPSLPYLVVTAYVLLTCCQLSLVFILFSLFRDESEFIHGLKRGLLFRFVMHPRRLYYGVIFLFAAASYSLLFISFAKSRSRYQRLFEMANFVNSVILLGVALYGHSIRSKMDRQRTLSYMAASRVISTIYVGVVFGALKLPFTLFYYSISNGKSPTATTTTFLLFAAMIVLDIAPILFFALYLFERYFKKGNSEESRKSSLLGNRKNYQELF